MVRLAFEPWTILPSPFPVAEQSVIAAGLEEVRQRPPATSPALDAMPQVLPHPDEDHPLP
jgi:hypothetical protein